MTSLATAPLAPVGNFSELRKQAALRFFLLVGAPLFIWGLARMAWNAQTLVQLIKAASYAVMSFEVWLSAPQVSGPLLTGFVVLWLALTTQSVLGIAELHTSPNPDEKAVERGLAIYRRIRLMRHALAAVVSISVTLAVLSGCAKWVHGVDSSESLTAWMTFIMLGLAVLAVSPLANVVLPRALRNPWATEEGSLRAGAALQFFGESPWSGDQGSVTWSLPQYGQVLLYDLARRAGALDQVRHALNLQTKASPSCSEEDNG